jgi:copper transport protein
VDAVRRLGSTVVVLLALVWAPAALAHANLVSTTPGDGATVATAPTEVRVLFDDPVTVGPGNAVVASDRTSVMSGKPRVERAGRELVLPLQELADGDYSARWRIISDDGHLESGVLAFRVGSGGGPAPQSILKPAGGNPSTLDVLARWLLIGGVLVAGGAALFFLLVTRACAREAAGAVTVGLIAVVLGGAWLLHATDDAATRFGHATQAAVVIAGVGAIAAALARLTGRYLVPAMIPALLLLVEPSLAGHASRPADDRPLSVFADLVHVTAAAFWIGGLVQLALLLLRGRAGDAPRRFSQLALVAVVAIAASGVGRAVVELSSVSQLWSTGYGRAILVKTVLFAVVIVIAATGSRRLLSAPLRLLRSVEAEIAVLALVVVAVGVLTALRPGRDAVARAAAAAGGPIEVAAAPAPPRGAVVFADEADKLAVALAVQPGRPLRLTATVIGQKGLGVDGLDVGVAAMDGSRSASAVARPCGHGCYEADVPFGSKPTAFDVTVNGTGRFQSLRFAVPGAWPPPPGTAFLRRATRVFDALDSVVLRERLRSQPDNGIHTTWKLVRPYSLEYSIDGGAGGIVIRTRRWDRLGPGQPWKRSQSVLLPQPTAPWGKTFENVRVLDQTANRLTASWVDPSIPAWYTATFDRASGRPTTMQMTAAGHFMRHRYVAYNTPVVITPPKRVSK